MLVKNIRVKHLDIDFRKKRACTLAQARVLIPLLSTSLLSVCGISFLLLAWCARPHIRKQEKTATKNYCNAMASMIVYTVSVAKNNNASLQNDKLMHTASESY